MRYWVIALAFLAAIPASADVRFRVRQMTRDDVPFGKGQCDIRLQVDGQVEVSVRRDMVFVRTISGQEARDDGSECNFPLPDRDPRGFNFQVTGSRNEIRLTEAPNRRNDFAAMVLIRDSSGGFGRYQFRLNWEAGPGGPPPREEVRREEPGRPGPGGFVWNNVMNFRGRGQGETRFNGRDPSRLLDVTVDIDRGGKIIVSFQVERSRRPEQFSGIVTGREGPRIKAEMTTEDGRLRGPMFLSVDDRNNVNSITLDATDGRDRMHVDWNRR